MVTAVPPSATAMNTQWSLSRYGTSGRIAEWVAASMLQHELAVKRQVGQLLGPEGAKVALGFNPPEGQRIDISLW
jgi:hypothetical protein